MKQCSKCGADNSRDNQRYCLKCHAAYMRDHRPKHSDLSDEQRKKANCRAYANMYRKRGKLVQKPCEQCGDENSQMHHDDYENPLIVQWLCRRCHLELHKL